MKVRQPGRTLRRVLALLAVALGVAGTASAADGVRSAAVFDFELIDSSLEGEVSGANPLEQQRLQLISDLLRSKLRETGRYRLVDTAPARAAIEAAGYLHGCNGCEADIAHSLNAELAISGTVQKVSNLILNINLYVRDTATRERRAYSVDIRGNTDKSWSRGVSYIVRNRLQPR